MPDSGVLQGGKAFRGKTWLALDDHSAPGTIPSITQISSLTPQEAGTILRPAEADGAQRG